MAQPSKESQINLALQAIQTDPKLSSRRAVKIFNVPLSTLLNRMKGKRARQDTHSASSQLTKLEEDAIVKYVIDLDSRGFAPRLNDVEDMANNILAARDALHVGTH
ncbi:transposase [Colletotrichum chrysophilum]|uniref:Transposase n=1 Tax=Colletotrichum chrysophilum TaxID=1836956 RepID=A0AAD9E8C2_9PEZI|nr:transposase [Colletotrichum chrysophilum]